jgi:sulfopyruvate decarboxylase TPP-binding subunit
MSTSTIAPTAPAHPLAGLLDTAYDDATTLRVTLTTGEYVVGVVYDTSHHGGSHVILVDASGKSNYMHVALSAIAMVEAKTPLT